MHSLFKLLTTAAICFLSMAILCTAAETGGASVGPATSLELKTGPTISVETLGVIRSVNISDGEQYGVGLDAGVKFNAWVTGHARLVAYQDDHWRGSAVDEGSLLVEARLFGSDSGRVTLSGVAGGDYDVDTRDFGISVGPRVAFVLTKRISLVFESRIRAWFNKTQKDLSTTGGLRIELF